MIITKKEAERIVRSKEKVLISLNLGISTTIAYIKEGFVLIKDQKIPIPDFKKVKDDTCYLIEDNSLKKVALFSDDTNFYYKLVPTADWPTITLSSTPMHRHTQISPKQDTISKINEIKPIKGKIIDTCCGLGYTAIMASKNAEEVYTFEKDKNVLQIARFNPFSEELFNSKKIKIFEEDVCDGISKFRDGFFDRIIHDPPTFKYAPELYSKKFCLELFRVLKKQGIIYHYAPWPHKTKSRVFYPKIIRNLRECGFRNVQYSQRSSGVRALK